MDTRGPIKSVIISANLQKGLKYRLCPSTEFSEGVWNITISNIGYICNIPNYQEICEISCNVVKAQKYNETFEVQTYDQPFGIFVLESKKKTVNFGKIE